MKKDDCLFCKIAVGEIKSEIVYKDKDFMIIKDINPKAKIHLLAIPINHFNNDGPIEKGQSKIIAKILDKLSSLLHTLGLDDGYRLVVNEGKSGGPMVKHFHIHILGGEILKDF